MWRWAHPLVKNFKNSKNWKRNLKRHASFWPLSTSVNPADKTKAETLIRADSRITLDQLAPELAVSHGSAHKILIISFFKSVPAGLGPETADR